MSWTHLDCDNTSDVRLDLYVREGEFMIRADGLELMNSQCSQSEVLLAEMACEQLVRISSSTKYKSISALQEPPRILLAGLGLGFTLNSLESALDRDMGLHSTELVVVEKSPAVVRWYQHYFRQNLFSSHSKRESKMIIVDVVQHLRGQRLEYDVILLDVDNGPQGICGLSNNWLYSCDGLVCLREALREHGKILLWSSFLSTRFETLAVEAGFCVTVQSVPLRHSRIEHYIYSLGTVE